MRQALCGKEVIYLSKLERAVASSGSSAFSMKFQLGFPAEILSNPNPFSDGRAVLMGDIVHPDDYQPFCEVINEIVSGGSEEMHVHARILTGGEYRWYYISALAVRNESGSLLEMDGMMFDVSAYLDCEGEDAVMRRFRSKSTEHMDSAQHTPELADILGEDYLARIQQPFSHIKGLYSAIVGNDGEIIATASGQDKRVNLNKLSYQRKKSIRIKRQTVASWVIAGESQEDVNDNAQLLETMVQTVSGIANSYVVLCEATDNSQSANKLLGQNFEDQILINNIYALSFASDDSKTSASSILPLICSYFDLDEILFSAGESAFAKFYSWDEDGFIFPTVSDIRCPKDMDKELKSAGVICMDERILTEKSGADRSVAVVRAYINGGSGAVFYIPKSRNKVWSNRDRKLLKTITQILATIIGKSLMEDKLAASQEYLHRLAYYDFTTNIPNRSMFERDFESLIKSQGGGAVISVEISNLKAVSEIYSTEYADDILKSVAEYISAIPCSAEKKVYRFSNDILFITFLGSSRDEAKQLAQVILTKFRSPWYLNDTEHHLELYCGVTICPDDADDIADCIKAATRTLRLAKERRLCDAVFYSEGLEEQLSDNLKVKKLIIDAAENDFHGFYYLYTPVLSMDTGELQCCEANLFWGNEDMIVSRERFLPIIDRMGLEEELYRHAVGKICQFCADVREHGFDSFRVSFTIPENILNSDSCIETLRSILQEYSLPPSAISISVSESARTLNSTCVNLNLLSRIGVTVIADDNGESFFTEAPLDNPAVRIIKIRAGRLTDDQISGTFIRSVIKHAHDNNIAVCIRGVDNAQTLERISGFDVDLVQGILNGRPLHSSEFLERMVMSEPVGRH